MRTSAAQCQKLDRCTSFGNSTKKAKEISDFRREDGVWVRTPKEKGTV